MLRAHGLIQKIPKTHRYQLSPHGRDVINALLIARKASTAQLAAGKSSPKEKKMTDSRTETLVIAIISIREQDAGRGAPGLSVYFH
jgi:hypothetical protein